MIRAGDVVLIPTERVATGELSLVAATVLDSRLTRWSARWVTVQLHVPSELVTMARRDTIKETA